MGGWNPGGGAGEITAVPVPISEGGTGASTAPNAAAGLFDGSVVTLTSGLTLVAATNASTPITVQGPTSGYGKLYSAIDYRGAPIWWIEDAGGEYITDNITLTKTVYDGGVWKISPGQSGWAELIEGYGGSVLLNGLYNPTVTATPQAGGTRSGTPYYYVAPYNLLGEQTGTLVSAVSLGGDGSVLLTWPRTGQQGALGWYVYYSNNGAFGASSLLGTVSTNILGGSPSFLDTGQATTAGQPSPTYTGSPQFLAYLGSAALPGYGFATDQSTGFYYGAVLGVPYIGITIGGTELLQINGSSVLYPVTDNSFILGGPANRFKSIAAVAFLGAPGSVGAPSISGYVDPTTGLYFSVGGQMTATAAGAAIWTISSTGLLLAAPIAMSANKITNLANGSGAQDAAAFGQIPVLDGTAGDIAPVGTQAAGAVGKAADAGHVHATTTAAGNLAADVSLATSATTPIMSTAALGVGKWLVTFSCSIANAAGGGLEFQAIAGTAAVTFAGCTSSQPGFTALGPAVLAFTFLATVTGAGTLTFTGKNDSATITSTAKATTPASGLAKATGYTALQVG